MCTVLLRFSPGSPWPVVAGAVRDEFTERPWDPPGRHWNGARARLIGGRDHTAGGTWLAVDPQGPGLAALLNGVRRPPPEHGTRPTRGHLALDLLAHGTLPDDLADYDRFHLLRAQPDRAELWTWDAEELTHVELEPGAHIVVNLGLDASDDPLVPHFAPLVEGLPDPADDLDQAWPAWLTLLEGDDLAPDDERALLVRREVEGRSYGSTSASLVALGPDRLRYAFTASPHQPGGWFDVVPAPAG